MMTACLRNGDEHDGGYRSKAWRLLPLKNERDDLLSTALCVFCCMEAVMARFAAGQFQRYGHYKSHKIEDLRRSYHTLKKVLSEHIYILYKAFILNDV